MGPGALVMVRRENSGAAKRPLTSPPHGGGSEEGREEPLRRQHEQAGPGGGGHAAAQIALTRPWPDSAVLRTRLTTKAAATRGIRLATIRIGVKEKRSATMPMA